MARKCLQFFQPSFALSRVLSWLLGSLCCRCLIKSIPVDKDRVAAFDAAVPDCACESHKMSKSSPGLIGGDERLSRFVWRKDQLDKRGRVRSNFFSQIATSGCSLQRESRAGSPEIATFVGQYLTKNTGGKWLGVVITSCDAIRKLRIDDQVKRPLCVYDTAEKDNPCHCEIFKTKHLEAEDVLEMREKLVMEFDTLVPPTAYRGGEIWRSLPQVLQNR